MKKITFSAFLIPALFFLLVLSLSNCKKKEIPGPKGEAGANGTGGNSSTSSSESFLVSSIDWVAATDSWQYTYNSNLITKKVADEGAVKVYIQKDGAWWELPHADGDLLTQCGFSEGKIKLVHADIHGGLPNPPANTTYRIVTLFESARACQEMGTVYPSNVSVTSTISK
jgi:hypothetical protein